MRHVPLFVLLVILAGCARYAGVQNSHRGDDPLGTKGTPVSPIQFLERLKQATNDIVIVLDNRRDWILGSDIEPLFHRLGSEARCPVVVSMPSSYWPVGISGSTERHEAALLIEGFRKGHYPQCYHLIYFIQMERS